jgi:hypothetical protein
MFWGARITTNWSEIETIGSFSQNWSVDVSPLAAKDAVNNQPSDYRSILILEGTARGRTGIQLNPAESGANYSLSTFKNYANSPKDFADNANYWYLHNYGPGIYQVHLMGSSDHQDGGAVGLFPNNIPGQALWLDAYGWESGYIYLEQKKTGQYGWGYVPGVITVTSSGLGLADGNFPNMNEKSMGRGGDVGVSLVFAADPGLTPQININGRGGVFSG